jgi:hypothetical protein
MSIGKYLQYRSLHVKRSTRKIRDMIVQIDELKYNFTSNIFL